VSDLGGTVLIMLTLVISYLYLSRSASIYVLVHLFVAGYMNGFQKLFYQQPRPFWVDSGVKAIMCGRDFGMPSGHSSNSMHISVMIGFELISNGYSWGLTSWIIGLIGVPLTVGISRLYVGVHSIDQVLMGW